MQKWEYVVRTFSGGYGGLKQLAQEMNRVLGAAGEQGWELFDIHFDSRVSAGKTTGALGKMSHSAIVTLKRPKQE
jgi:hypothetical protein